MDDSVELCGRGVGEKERPARESERKKSKRIKCKFISSDIFIKEKSYGVFNLRDYPLEIMSNCMTLHFHKFVQNFA